MTDTIPAQDEPGESDRDAIAIAAVRLAGRKGWRTLSLAEIAAEAGVSLADLASCFVCRQEMLDQFERIIDRRMLGRAVGPDSTDRLRDRLFDLLMERFEALQPFREGVNRIARDLPFDPASGLVLAAALPRTVAWMYAGAGVPVEGPLMPLRIAALSGLYLSVFRTWSRDDGPDLAKTMAALDRALDKASGWIGRLDRTPAAMPETEPAEPEPQPQ